MIQQHPMLFINRNITKKEMDELIINVNNKINKQDNSINDWILQYEKEGKLKNNFLSFEVKDTSKYEENTFYSLRNYEFQFPKKYITLHNDEYEWINMPPDYNILSLIGFGNKKNGIILFQYSNACDKIIYTKLLKILNEELEKLGAKIIMVKRRFNLIEK